MTRQAKPLPGRTAPALRVVGATRSDETVAALEHLLSMAYRGEVVGLAYCAMERGGRAYSIGAAGEARRSPTFARGMVAALDDELRDML